MSSFSAARPLIAAALLTMTVSACGDGAKEGGNSVAMKDLEVVDGTASDAMTDLDGVRAEGTALAPGAASTNASEPAKRDGAPAKQESDTEVLSDQ